MSYIIETSVIHNKKPYNISKLGYPPTCLDQKYQIHQKPSIMRIMVLMIIGNDPCHISQKVAKSLSHPINMPLRPTRKIMQVWSIYIYRQPLQIFHHILQQLSILSMRTLSYLGTSRMWSLPHHNVMPFPMKRRYPQWSHNPNIHDNQTCCISKT